MTRSNPEWKQDKTRYRKRLDVAMMIAILFTFCLLGFTRPIQLKRITLEETVIQLIEPPPSRVIPPRPPEISRPKIVIASLDESVVEEETIASTSFDPNLMTSLPPPPPTREGFFTFDKAPKPLRIVRPVYPTMARQLEIDCLVRCLVTIGPRGSVLKVVIHDSDNEMFDARAIAALEQWIWEPAEQSGSPVKATVLVPLRFSVRR